MSNPGQRILNSWGRLPYPRILWDPMGRECTVRAVYDQKGAIAYRYSGFVWDRYVPDAPIESLPARWQDPDRVSDAELWERACPALPGEKLAQMVEGDAGALIETCLNRSEYRRIVTAPGPGLSGWPPFFRAVAHDKAWAVAAFVAHDVNPYTKSNYGMAWTDAVELALDQFRFGRANFDVVRLLVGHPSIDPFHVQQFDNAAEPYRRMKPLLRISEVNQMLDAIRTAMVNHNLYDRPSTSRTV